VTHTHTQTYHLSLPVSSGFRCERVEGITESCLRALHVKHITAVSCTPCPKAIFEHFMACREYLGRKKSLRALQDIGLFPTE